jgi:DNA (cytosine-5)-methyltransferase 1
MLKVVELFAGVGGFRIGLEGYNNKSCTSGFKDKIDNKFDVIWSNQYEPLTPNNQHAFKVLKNRWPKNNHSNVDIHNVKTKDIPDSDVLVGGFPCQDYSVATSLRHNKDLKTGGVYGKKGVLWWQIERILREKKDKKPKYLILENVDRLLKSPSTQRGRDFAVMLASLNKLDYAVEWRVINAADYGFPQRRRRVFILGYLKGTSNYKLITEKYKSKKINEWIDEIGTLAKAFKVSEIIDDLITFRLLDGKSSIKTIKDLELVSKNFGKSDRISKFKNAGVAFNGKVYTYHTSPIKDDLKDLNSILHKNQNEVDSSLFIDENKEVEPRVYYQIDREPIVVKTIGDKWKYLKGRKNEERISKSTGAKYKYGEGKMIYPDEADMPSRTIITGEGGSSPSRFKHVIKTKKGLRRLTPVELERLNGFPDEHTKLEGITDTKRAFFMGNALVCGIVEKIGKALSL